MLRVRVVASQYLTAADIAGRIRAADIDAVVDSPHTGRDEGRIDAVVLVDDGDGVDAPARDGSGAARLLLSANPEDSVRLRRPATGGYGWLPRDAPPRVLQAAVRAAVAGLFVAPAGAAPALARTAAPGDEGVAETLTARERQVLELLADGLTNKRIARRLGISDQTVKFHVSAILAKLGASGRTDAVRRGLRRGLLTL
jgi:DNA-binding NarL/FixJ family response regulator